MNEDFPFVSFMCLLIFLFLGLFTIGHKVGKDSIHKEAVEKGVGKWEVDSDGDTTFRWLTTSEISAKGSEETEKDEVDTTKEKK